MSGFISLDIKGAVETAEQLTALSNALPGEVNAVMVDAMSQVQRDVATYPDQPPYMGMARYGSKVHAYVRTGAYGAGVHSSVMQSGSEITGYVEQGAPHSIWLRGDLSGYPGAWMHPTWRKLVDIVQEWTPRIQAMLDDRAAAVIARIMGK